MNILAHNSNQAQYQKVWKLKNIANLIQTILCINIKQEMSMEAINTRYLKLEPRKQLFKL